MPTIYFLNVKAEYIHSNHLEMCVFSVLIPYHSSSNHFSLDLEFYPQYGTRHRREHCYCPAGGKVAQSAQVHTPTKRQPGLETRFGGPKPTTPFYYDPVSTLLFCCLSNLFTVIYTTPVKVKKPNRTSSLLLEAFVLWKSTSNLMMLPNQHKQKQQQQNVSSASIFPS